VWSDERRSAAALGAAIQDVYAKTDVLRNVVQMSFIDIVVFAYSCSVFRLDFVTSSQQTGESRWPGHLRTEDISCGIPCTSAIVIVNSNSYNHWHNTILVATAASPRLLSREVSERECNAQGHLPAEAATTTRKIKKRANGPDRTSFAGTFRRELGDAQQQRRIVVERLQQKHQWRET
jgi:hypothetical protein